MNDRIPIALAMALFATGAFASSYPTFQQLDANGDGVLTEAEMADIDEFRGEESEFAQSDLDDNGVIDLAEYTSWVEDQTGTAKADDASDEKVKTN